MTFHRNNTTDLTDFSKSALRTASELLNAWVSDGLPGFDEDQVTVMLNPNSGYVFLTNAETQVAVMEHGKLVEFHSSPYACHEGTLNDLIESFDAETWHPEDIEWFNNLNTQTEGA